MRGAKRTLEIRPCMLVHMPCIATDIFKGIAALLVPRKCSTGHCPRHSVRVDHDQAI